MPVLTPNFLATRFAAMTMPSPRRPPPTHTGRPCSFSLSAISQLAKKLSPSTCRMRFILYLRFTIYNLRAHSGFKRHGKPHITNDIVNHEGHFGKVVGTKAVQPSHTF